VIGVALVLTGVASQVSANGRQETVPPGQGQGRTLGQGPGTSQRTNHDTISAALAGMPVGTLRQGEAEGLIYLHEEERLARDVYTALAELYQVPVFSNIAASEQTHVDGMAVLLKRYGLAVPPDGKPGSYQDAQLVKTYQELMTRGKQGLAEAAAVGISIEEMDIADLEMRLARTDNADVRLVLEQLLAGSRNHLAAFQRQSARR